MTTYLPLYLAKKHLNLDPDFHEDDEYIAHLILVVQTVVEREIEEKLAALEDEEGYIPEPLLHAMLLILGQYYDNRESISHGQVHELPKSYQYLCDQYRNYNPKCKRP